MARNIKKRSAIFSSRSGEVIYKLNKPAGCTSFGAAVAWIALDWNLQPTWTIKGDLEPDDKISLLEWVLKDEVRFSMKEKLVSEVLKRL